MFVKTRQTLHNGGMANVVLDQVCKTFDKTTILTDISLDIQDREFVVLVGPSGCGKSTVLRLIAGLETLSSGNIHIADRRVNDVPAKDRDIAMVFQNYALYPHMSVYDNMAFGLKMRKFPKDEMERRVRDAARILDLDALLDRKPRQLSGGQRQRVALGRAIVRDPKVFLMDEPLSNLDAKLRVQMRAEISKLHKRLKATTLYVTHDQVEAMTMGDRIVILDKGIIQQADRPLVIYNQPNNLFVAGFIGQMNFLSGTLDRGTFYVASKEGAEGSSVVLPLPEAVAKMAEGYTGKDAILGIRPEHFSVPLDGERPDLPALEVTATLVEALGSEKLVHFSVLGQSMVANVPTQHPVGMGDSLWIVPKLSHAHLFDAQTQERLTSADCKRHPQAV